MNAGTKATANAALVVEPRQRKKDSKPQDAKSQEGRLHLSGQLRERKHCKTGEDQCHCRYQVTPDSCSSTIAPRSMHNASMAVICADRAATVFIAVTWGTQSWQCIQCAGIAVHSCQPNLHIRQVRGTLLSNGHTRHCALK